MIRTDAGVTVSKFAELLGVPWRTYPARLARHRDPNSAGAQYFFTVTPDAGRLDGQGTYVVFGDAIEGLDVLTDMLASHVDIPDNPLGGASDPPVVVNSVAIK